MADIWSKVPGEAREKALDYWQFFGERLVAHAQLNAGAQVLDMGCGTGSSLIPASAVVGKSGNIVGIDLCDH